MPTKQRLTVIKGEQYGILDNILMLDNIISYKNVS